MTEGLRRRYYPHTASAIILYFDNPSTINGPPPLTQGRLNVHYHTAGVNPRPTVNLLPCDTAGVNPRPTQIPSLRPKNTGGARSRLRARAHFGSCIINAIHSQNAASLPSPTKMVRARSRPTKGGGSKPPPYGAGEHSSPLRVQILRPFSLRSEG